MSVSRKRRARALRAFVERLTCYCMSCYWWRANPPPAYQEECWRVRP
jgi:hypothetical protein